MIAAGTQGIDILWWVVALALGVGVIGILRAAGLPWNPFAGTSSAPEEESLAPLEKVEDPPLKKGELSSEAKRKYDAMIEEECDCEDEYGEWSEEVFRLRARQLARMAQDPDFDDDFVLGIATMLHQEMCTHGDEGIYLEGLVTSALNLHRRHLVRRMIDEFSPTVTPS